jgi:hypothetical protein
VAYIFDSSFKRPIRIALLEQALMALHNTILGGIMIEADKG